MGLLQDNYTMGPYYCRNIYINIAHSAKLKWICQNIHSSDQASPTEKSTDTNLTNRSAPATIEWVFALFRNPISNKGGYLTPPPPTPFGKSCWRPPYAIFMYVLIKHHVILSSLWCFLNFWLFWIWWIN